MYELGFRAVIYGLDFSCRCFIWMEWALLSQIYFQDTHIAPRLFNGGLPRSLQCNSSRPHLNQVYCLSHSPTIHRSNRLDLKLAHSIINDISTKSSSRPKNSRVPKLHRHILNPLMMIRVIRMSRRTRILRLLRNLSWVETGLWIIPRVLIRRWLTIWLG